MRNSKNLPVFRRTGIDFHNSHSTNKVTVFYCCTVHFEDSLNIIHQQMHQSYYILVQIIYIKAISLLLHISGAGMYVDCGPHTSLHQRQRTHKYAYMICCHNTHNNGILLILTHDFSQELYALPDGDMQCAIETRRNSESVLM